MKILLDAQKLPALFVFHGPIQQDELQRIIGSLPSPIPKDLVDFWCATGGGDVFETETLLGPCADPSLGDNLVVVNRALWAQGKPRHLLLFHRGYCHSYVDISSQHYIVLDKAYEAVATYKTFDDWYVHVLRNEFGARYGLQFAGMDLDRIQQ